MATPITKDKNQVIPEFLTGGGELGQLIRDFNWENTALGPVGNWPQSLRTCVRIMLTSRQPIWIGWGKDLIKLYNDPYKAIVGGKHPWALGKPASTVWKDIWREIGPMLKQVMEDDQGTFVESQLLIMERNGYQEETYYTFSYTPIPGDDGNTAGMICANSDDTDRILGERQLKTLTQLGKNLTDSRLKEDVARQSIATLRGNPYDFPFVMFYNVEGEKAVLFEHTDSGSETNATAGEIDLQASNKLAELFNRAISTRKFQVLENLEKVLGPVGKGAWEKSPHQALILPITHLGSKDPYSILVFGCNPYRLLNEAYLAFFTLMGDQIATSLANVYALEEERRRAKALAEIDRAKTAFFSNISHEFRTPLTLILGPIEETLDFPEMVAETKARMSVAHRNALRLQRMVNTLLEFSRIEAGKIDGKFNLVDISRFTYDLASTFRSAIEKAGMQLLIHCEEIDGEVYVDKEMWERIILNLVSNAFKYSKEGAVTVEIRQAGMQAQLIVSDTGIGIPPDQLDKIFDRFHRIENVDGRSREGTGIGLAIVKELVKFHNGSISVDSNLGIGSTFTVSLPIGRDHIAADKIFLSDEHIFPSDHSMAFIQEASRWVSPDHEKEPDDHADIKDPIRSIQEDRKYSVLLADDNADMREYVERLLSRKFNVTTASNGEDAFYKAMKNKPDLLLSDIMMPKLDGFGLLEKIRNYPETMNIPVILLSARAGEEAKIEGLDAGADDYLVKPFSAKELIARVDANIKIAKDRLSAEQNLRNVIKQSPVPMAILKGETLVIEMVNDLALEHWGRQYEELINLPAFKAFPELVDQGFDKILREVYQTGKPFMANEMPVTLIRQAKAASLYMNLIFQPLYNHDKTIYGIVGVGIDVSEHVIARQIIQKAEERAILAIESADLGTYEINLLTNEMSTSERFNQIWGIGKALSRQEIAAMIHPDDKSLREEAHKQSLIAGNLHYEARVIWSDRSIHWVRVKGKVIYDGKNKPVSLLGVIQDITEQKSFSEHLARLVTDRTYELQRSNEDLQQFAHVASHDLKEPVRKIMTFSSRLRDEYGDSLPDQARVFIEKVLHSGERMYSMIEGVLNYSKINSFDQLTEAIDLNEIFRSIGTDLEIFIREKKATIKKTDLPVIEGASFLIYQLFYNLLNNSLKFSKANEPCTIAVSGEVITEGDREMAKILIQDNGIGFSNEYKEKIFDTFTRLNSKDKYEGTGLGLALCKKIVERHKGRIMASGENFAGAKFCVFLPVRQITIQTWQNHF